MTVNNNYLLPKVDDLLDRLPVKHILVVLTQSRDTTKLELPRKTIAKRQCKLGQCKMAIQNDDIRLHSNKIQVIRE